ncbi:MAG: hypothetical protein B6D56_07350 [Candidatus Omnitrophica bacterium 4484_70.1]|nr:MAG: hypothetical protein B6D56_07350 [Candidatus Omnitrophica bacterium 4484_70.1]
MNNSTEETIATLRDYLMIIFRHMPVLIITFVTVVTTVIVGLQLKTPFYQAQVKMLISAEKQVEAPYYRNLLRSQSSEVILTQSEIVKSNPVIERTVRALRLYERPLDYEKKYCSNLKKFLINFRTKNLRQKLSRLTNEQKKAFRFRLAMEELKRNIKVSPIRDTNLFTINVRDFSPIGAAIIANVLSRAYVIFDLEQQLAELQLKYGDKHPTVIQIRDNIKQMEKTLNGKPLPNIKAIGPASVKIVEQAEIPLKPIGPPANLTISLAVVMSLFLGVMLIFLLEYIDQTVKSPQNIEKFLGIPYLGSIPRKKKFKEKALHNISDQLYLLMKDRKIKSLLVTACLPKEETTIIVANLGRDFFQRQSQRVLVIDANLRNPCIHRVFNIPCVPGLTEVVEGKVPFNQAVRRPVFSSFISPPGEGNSLNACLDVLPARRTELNPLILLGSSKMQEVINIAKQEYEVVLVDCPNLRNFKDTIVLSQFLDGAILVINEGKARRQVVKTTIGPLKEKKVYMIGAILNNRVFAMPKMIYNHV